MSAKNSILVSMASMLLISSALAEKSDGYAKAAQQEFSKGNLLTARILAVEAVKQAEVWEEKFPQCGTASGSNSIAYTVFYPNDALRLFRVEEGAIAYYDIRGQGVRRLWKAALADNTYAKNKVLNPTNPVSKQFSDPITGKLNVIVSCGTQPQVKTDMVEFVYTAPPGSLSIGLLSSSGQYINKADYPYDESRCQNYRYLKITYCKQVSRSNK